MSEGDSDFRLRPGRIRSTRAPKAKSFLNQVLRAAKKAGHTGAPASGRRASSHGHSTFGRGRGSFSRSRLFSSTRRVVIKARVVHSRISDVDQELVTYRSGMEFVDMPDRIATAISAFLDGLKAERVTRT